ncbi:MAG: glycine--tRNA ligase subunit beta, partial [Pseudomonadota bacterium]
MSDIASRELLVEVGCEELPPLALDRLTAAFYDGVCSGLEEAGISFDREQSRSYSTPRRMSLLFSDVAERQPDRVLERKGPSVNAAFDDDGQPTRAALGFAASVGQPVAALERLETDKGAWLFCHVDETGKPLSDLLFPILAQALDRLPVPRPMRWSDHDFSFVRPVHWLVVVHGTEVIEGELYGCKAGRETHGHRIHAPGAHPLESAEGYAERLQELHVIVDPDARRARIREEVEQAGKATGGIARITPELLDEVNNIVEWPVAVACTFEARFLSVPQEALIASMESHQKFFPVLDEQGALTSSFVVVANIESRDEQAMGAGFERVIRPRLADAQFFWEQDLKQPLDRWSAQLDSVVFQKDLGTIGDKSRRIASISKQIAELAGAEAAVAEAAARQCKLDLVSLMVGEFPELQGVMGAYYLTHAKALDGVPEAVRGHYQPRFAGDALPATRAGQIVALADRIDTLVGIFAVGLKPTGNKDPFALRRSAIAVIRLLEEGPFDLTIAALVDLASETLAEQLEPDAGVRGDVRHFILERLKNHLVEGGTPLRQVNAVLAAPLGSLADLRARLDALAHFMGQDGAESLAAANKRIGNILKKQEMP